MSLRRSKAALERVRDDRRAYRRWIRSVNDWWRIMVGADLGAGLRARQKLLRRFDVDSIGEAQFAALVERLRGAL